MVVFLIYLKDSNKIIALIYSFSQTTTILLLFKSVVKKAYISPPSFNLCFLRISSTLSRKFLVVTFHFLFSKGFNSFLLYGMIWFTLKTLPGNFFNCSEVYK